MKIVIGILFLACFCFAQEQTIEQRISDLEAKSTKTEAQMTTLNQDVSKIVTYLNNCHLELEYYGQGSFGRCPYGSVMAEWSQTGNPPYVTTWVTCYKYQLVCR